MAAANKELFLIFFFRMVSIGMTFEASPTPASTGTLEQRFTKLEKMFDEILREVHKLVGSTPPPATQAPPQPTPPPSPPPPRPTPQPTPPPPPRQYRLVKKFVECKSADKNMGNKNSVDSCAKAVKDNGGSFFIFGINGKAGRCYQENTASEKCSEGWERDNYNFYALPGQAPPPPPLQYRLVKRKVECKSADKSMGNKNSVDSCAKAVKDNGGSFFIFGINGKAGRCLQENTASEKCSEGWEIDNYNFYALLGQAPPSTPPSPPPPPTVRPSGGPKFHCDFEDGGAYLHNVCRGFFDTTSCVFPWRKTGSGKSFCNKPAGLKISAASGKNFMYWQSCRTSMGKKSCGHVKSNIKTRKTLTLGRGASVSFQYLLWGREEMYPLGLMVRKHKGPKITVWQAKGQKDTAGYAGMKWKSASVSLHGFAGMEVQIEFTQGKAKTEPGCSEGDAGLDSVTIDAGLGGTLRDGSGRPIV